MAILRGMLPTDSFTIISNAWLRDSALSWKAKGLLAYISSHAAGHSLTSEQIVAEGTDGKDAVRAGLVELEERGYLRRVQQRGDGGKITGTDYLLQEPDVGKTSAGKPAPGSDQGEHDVSAGGDQCGKSSAGQPAGKKTTPKKTTQQDQEAFDAEASPTAQTILAGFIDWLALPAQEEIQLSKRVIGMYARSIKALLGEGFSEKLIKLALVEMHHRGMTGRPSLLEGFVVQVQQTKPVSGAPAAQSFKRQDADDRDREHLIVQAMDVVLTAHPSMKAAEARQVVLSGLASGALDLNVLRSSAATGYIDAEEIDPEVKEVTGS